MIVINRILDGDGFAREKTEYTLNKISNIDNRTNRELYVLAYELFTLFPNLVALATHNKPSSLTWYELIRSCKNNNVLGVNHNIETTINTDTILNSISTLLYNNGKGYNDLKYIDHIDLNVELELKDNIMSAPKMVKVYPALVKSLRKPNLNLYPRPLYNDKVEDGDVVSLNTIDEEFQAMIFKLRVVGVIDFFRRAYKLLIIKID
jgi:hypothetical protein